MNAQSPVVGWKEVRNQELSEVITRRLAAGMLNVEVLGGLNHKWSKNHLLPGSPGWAENLAESLEEWLDAGLLTPASLCEAVCRWQGILHPDASPITLERCGNLLEKQPFQRLAAVVQSQDLHVAMRALPEDSRHTIQNRWREKGWIGASESPLLPLRPPGTANGLEGLDRRAREDLKKSVQFEKVEKIRALLQDWEARGLAPLSTLLLGSPVANGSNQPTRSTTGYTTDETKEDPEHHAYKEHAAREWGQDGSLDEGQALDALMLEALVRGEVSRDLVGLALSGGGIRSASLNLGLLQALQKDRCLRDVDYLSTVSGGGYVGSFLSSMIHAKDVHLNPALGKEPPLAPEASGKLPENIVKLVRSGSFLNHPTLHLSRYLLGVLLNNLVLLSALVAVCTLVALAWRGMDMNPIESYIRRWSDGWITDWNRPFLPAFALFMIWFLISASYLAIYGPHGQPRFGHILLQCIGLFVLIGIAVTLATPNLDIPLLSSSSTAKDANVHQLLSIGNTPLIVLLTVVVFGLVPFLRPWRFLTSGTNPSGTGEQLIFRFLSVVLLGGIPFFLVYMIARHDIAHDLVGRPFENTSLRVELHETDIQYKRWPDFWTRLIAQSDNQPKSISGHFWKRLSKSEKRDVLSSLDNGSWKQLLPIPRDPEAWQQGGEGHVAAAIKELPIPLDDKARAMKKQILQAVNDKVIADKDFAADVLQDGGADLTDYVREKSADMTEGARLRSLLVRHEQGRLVPEDMLKLNRLFLEAYYGWSLWERAVVRRSVVIAQDQIFRLQLLGGATLIALLGSLVIGLNATSLHGIYRQQLAWLYLDPVAHKKTEPYLRLHELNTTIKGGPYHLISGSLDKGIEQKEGERPTVQFLFSPKFCGSTFTGFVPTKEYQKDDQGGTLDLATAMAISGAAFSPARVENKLIAFLMLVLNVRLGQWLPSPRHPRRVRRLPWLRLLLSLLFFRGVARRRYWFVTDGGHSENLGLGPLLRRQCKLIIVSDAGYDPDYGFDDFVKLYRHARNQGVQFHTLDQSGFIRMDPLVPDKANGLSPHRYLVARIKYPGPLENWGLLIYVKPSFAGDEAVDLVRYRRINTKFPHDPTANQWFDEDQVESYRELGSWIGQRVCESLNPPLQERREHPLDFDKVVRAFEAKVKQQAADRPDSNSVVKVPIEGLHTPDLPVEPVAGPHARMEVPK